MGEVYLARDTRLERNIALKLLPLKFTSDADRMRRFTQEAKAASALNHPNILTVHEIGESGQQPFIATEFVDGVTLRQSMTSGTLLLDSVLDIAIQIASALSAAHAAGIVHRDLKPENIMVRPDGVVKILDFGLAKLTAPVSTLDPEALTIASNQTTPGVVFGTMRYMSPEQARGIEVDERSDIFSLGVLLYEMLAGQPPFDGDTPSDVVAAILKTDPAPVARFMPDAPQPLLRTVEKALRKDREERYQSVKDLLIDLKDVKRDVEFEARLAHSVPSSEADAAGPDVPQVPPAMVSAASGADTSAWGLRHALRSLGDNPFPDRVMSKRRQIGLLAAASALILTAIALFSYFPRGDALTDRDTILLVDFDNSTGDPVFDGTLKQGLAVQLSQSPFLNIFPETRLRETLRLMGREPDEMVTGDVGREICQRQGLKAYVVGSIVKFDQNYSITLEAIGTQHGESLGLAQVEAEGKDQVLRALSTAATKLREGLGESLGSIEKFDAPLEVTTSSLEALKAYSLGRDQAGSGRSLEAIPFFERAVELDPNFAYAWVALAVHHFNTGQTDLAGQYAEKAFALRDRVSELERLRISSLFIGLINGDYDEAIEQLELYKRTYPRDSLAPTNLASAYVLGGEFDKAAIEAQEAIRLNPNTASPYGDLGIALLGLGRVTQAQETAEGALQQGLVSPDIRAALYMAGFLSGDRAAMQRQVDMVRGKPDEYLSLDWQARTAGAEGQWQRAQELERRSIELAAQMGSKEIAARYAANGVLRDAALGHCAGVQSDTAQALSFERTQTSLTRSALALALCRDIDSASSLLDELNTRYPTHTLIHTLWLPTIRGAVALHQADGKRALQELAAVRLEEAGELWPAYVRGYAFLRQRDESRATTEFRKILEHRGHAPLSLVYPLARLGLARAIALGEDTSRARNAYEDFFTAWKDADTNVPILEAAKTEYVRLTGS